MSGVVGQGVSLVIDRGKVNVSGYWPQRAGQNSAYVSPSDVQEGSPSISATLLRGPEAVAKEITRRFLPEYLRIWNKIKTKIDETNAYQSRKGANWKRLVDSGFIWRPRGDGNDSDPNGDVFFPGRSEDNYNYDKGYGEVRMTGENSVKIKLYSLPVETALKVLKVLTGEEA